MPRRTIWFLIFVSHGLTIYIQSVDAPETKRRQSQRRKRKKKNMKIKKEEKNKGIDEDEERSDE